MKEIDVVKQMKQTVLENIWESLKQTAHPDQLVFQMEYVRKEKFIAFLGGVMDMEASQQRKKAIAFSNWCSKNYQYVPFGGVSMWSIRQGRATLDDRKTTEELYNIWENEPERTMKQ